VSQEKRVCAWCGLTDDVRPVPSRGPVPRMLCGPCRQEEGLEAVLDEAFAVPPTQPKSEDPT
jgi:hypothetical protein